MSNENEAMAGGDAENEVIVPENNKNLLEYKSLRASTKGSLTRIKSLVVKKGATLSLDELECRLGILESYFKQMLSVQANIDKVCPEADRGSNAAFTAETEELYVVTKSKIMALISKKRPSVADISMLNNTVAAVPMPRLRREIKIPKFEGKYSDFPKFISVFNKMVHQDDSLDNLERMLILKESLGPKPLSAISDFDVTDENYPKALERLKKNFDKKSLMFEEHIASLFEMKKVSKGSSDHLRTVIDSVNAHLSAMLSIGNYKNIANAMLIYLVMGKVDPESQNKWEECNDFSKLSSWEECAEVLDRRCQILQARESKFSNSEARQTVSKDSHRESKGKQYGYKKNMQSSLAIGKILCELCHGQGHSLIKCPQFENMSARERYSSVRPLKICIQCLKGGHLVKDCTTSKCSICNLPHHKMLHRFDSLGSTFNKPLAPQPIQAPDHEQPSTSKQAEAHLSTQRAALHTTVVRACVVPEVFLETAVVLVKDVSGRFQTARVILDSASQINIMSSKLAEKLMLRKESCALGALGIGNTSTNINRKVQATIKSRFNDYQVPLEFYLLPKITAVKPDQFVDISEWRIPNNIELADPKFNIPARIDMLVGAEIFLDLLSIGRIQLGDKLPKLQKTVLGWVISGAAREYESKNLQSLLVGNHSNEIEALSKLVEKFWKIESIPAEVTFLTGEEIKCERIFEGSTVRDESGRFIVKIPFKSTVCDLGESLHTAERRFYALERRLNKNPEIKIAYAAFIEEYISLGHMVPVQNFDIAKIKYFAPHQHVLRPESTTTKLRVVFDCSCKTSSGISLNEVMLKGPVVQNDLLSIVLRFRCFKFALTADVAKMYRQILVTESDSYFQVILWRPSVTDQLKAYRLRTVTYGTTSAPYLATKCLVKLADDNAEQYPLGSRKVKTDFYMDDLISGANTEEELFQIYEEVSKITGSAHFPLRKWHSNNERFLNEVPDSEKEKPLRVNDTDVIKALGIVWEPSSDVFRYIWTPPESAKPITKRIVLAELSTLFDPLGLVNPLIVKAKVFMQDLWILKINWDESLPANLHSYWAEFRSTLKLVENVKVPRYILSTRSIVRVEMHGFSDASLRAYGCCIFLRSIDNENSVTVQLWSAKSRVAPLKTKSLPRLELLAAELLANLVKKLKENFPMPTDAVYLWTDSEIVLDWLAAHPSTWTTFVANRVSTIQEITETAVWRHVPSAHNPADIVSRGAYADELLDSIWFSGPKFLQGPCDKWPHNKIRTNAAGREDERRKGVVMHVTAEKNLMLRWIESNSQFEMVQRVVARLLAGLGTKSNNYREIADNLTAIQLDEALIRIIFCLQQHYFRTEWQALKSGREVSPSSKLQNLNLFLKVSYGVDLIRVGGRLRRADLPYDAKHQILLPDESTFVKTYVRHLHETKYHAGPQALIAIIRQRFWIPSARKVVRSVTGRCFRCFKCRPRLESQIMGDLPLDRVNISKPFMTTGVDFCGPVMTTLKQRGVKLTKSYISVFVCFATKAVHMEVVSDLTSKAFIAALKRFVARRGLCAKLYCDNATNFVGARRELEEFKNTFREQQMQNEISRYCAVTGIEFHHIPPRAPHFGGLWEAAVKSAKYHLNRILGMSYLTFEELSTVVAEIESILNSRPLTTMSSDPNDEEVLTPAHFLIGGPLTAVAEPFVHCENVPSLNRWLRITAMQQHFWKRWSTEYLHELQRRAKWTKSQRNIEEGDMVLVAEDNLPPKQWLLGRVIKAIRDESNHVRVVDLKTKKGEVRRAIHKVAPIPKQD